MKTKPQDRPARKPAAPTAPVRPAATWQRGAILAMALGTALLGATVIWAYPRPIGDLWVGLAGGQDVVQGRLGKNDTWSFATTDRVWINQNWGTHLVYYLAHQAGHRLGGQAGADNALLALKASMIALMGLGIALGARRRGAGWAVSVLVAGGVLLAGRAYIDQRPNLTTLMLAPWMLYLLLLARRQVHWVWAALALVLVWANSHGGFALGLGMMGLWAACFGLSDWLGGLGKSMRRQPTLAAAAWESFVPALRRYWPAVVVAAAGILLAGLLSPFGWVNLTHAFVVGGSSAWREVNEWRSIWQGDWGGFGSLWEFLLLMGLAGGVGLMHLLAWGQRRLRGDAQAPRADAPAPRSDADAVAWALFETILLLGAVYMACRARRFMPLAMVLVGPFLAVQLDWLLYPRRRAWPTAIACLLLAVPAGHLGWREVRYYSPRNPVAAPESMLDRMTFCYSMMPAPAAQFINDNRIEGRVLQEWRWEGYLRWRCPQLSLWVGGRAQQVYDEKDYILRQMIFGDPARAPRELAALDVHLMVVPWDRAGRGLIDHLARLPGATWAIIYFDGFNLIVADAAHQATRELVDKVVDARGPEAGGLRWPNDDIRELSRLLCMTSAPVGSRVRRQVLAEQARQAIRHQAQPMLPALLAEIVAGDSKVKVLPEADARLLEEQFLRWWALEQPRAGGAVINNTCHEIARLLAAHHYAAGHLAEAQTWDTRAAQAKARTMEFRGWVID